MTAIGDLRETVIVQRQVTTPDGLGGETRAWVNWLTLRAEVLPSKRGDALPIAEAVQEVQGYRCRVHFRRDIGIENRVVWRDRPMQVLSVVDEDGRRRWLSIFTDAGVLTQ